MDYELARYNMIEQQVRTWDVLDQRVLDMLSIIHREDFVPEQFRKLALADINIPLAHGQVTMQPKVEARLVQALNVTGDERILEIGTGCGYLTAILARFGKAVTSIDIHPEFTEAAANRLQEHGISNAELYTGDAINGWPTHAPYEVIVVTGSMPVLSKPMQEQLAIGGRMFVILGQSPVMEATLITRVSDTQWFHETLFETDLPALIGANPGNTFRF